MIVAFAGIVVFSLFDNSARAKGERALFDRQLVDCELGMAKRS
jgi:cation/acetate symporter